MDQETHSDVRDLPQHAIDATSFLNVIFALILVMPEKNVQHSSAYTAPPSWCHIVVHGVQDVREWQVSVQFFCVSARYVSEMCACRNNLYIPNMFI